MNPKIEEIVATLREYAPDEDGTSRYILIPAAGRGATAEYPVTVRSHITDIMRDAADLIEQLQQELTDAQPIVRCKDCVLRGDVGKCPMCYEIEHTWDDDGWDETTWETVDRTQDDGFCHLGRKEGER